jgi:hypothetical protein
MTGASARLMSRAGAAAGYPMNKHHFVLVVVGAYLWVMLILFGSIVLETFMVYPNIFHDPRDRWRRRWSS